MITGKISLFGFAFGRNDTSTSSGQARVYNDNTKMLSASLLGHSLYFPCIYYDTYLSLFQLHYGVKFFTAAPDKKPLRFKNEGVFIILSALKSGNFNIFRNLDFIFNLLFDFIFFFLFNRFNTSVKLSLFLI